MGYQRPYLMALVREELQRRPGTRLAEFARLHRVSASTLRRAFLTEVSGGFRAYRQEMLLDRAVAELTSRTPLLVKEISAELGFATPEAFGRWFRTRTGVSPSAYRANRDSPLSASRPQIDGGTPLAGGGDIEPLHVNRRARRRARGDV